MAMSSLKPHGGQMPFMTTSNSLFSSRQEIDVSLNRRRGAPHRGQETESIERAIIHPRVEFVKIDARL